MNERSPASPLWPLVVGFVALTAASFGVTRLVIAGDDTAATPSSAATIAATTPTETPPAQTQPTPTDTVATPTTPATTAPPPEVIPTDPLELLEFLRAQDFARAESLVGQWVPQVSAKRPGIEADGIVYQLPDIVALHAQLQQRFDALLLFSADFNYQSSNLWISIVPIGSAQPGDALQFCVDNGIDQDNCFAKFITHDLSITDTVELQP